ncbi:hypothetical protein [Streptosporangium saharense]|uniref:hypothetical protein n=1 Tax=Streptosporangium saharense TaxID=1706840 RepID=UPI00344343B2
MTQWLSSPGLLDEYEKRWEPLLRGVSLVVEAGIGADERAPVVAELGSAYRFWCAKGRPRDRFFENWAACVVVALSGVAVENYKKGSFWPHLWKRIGLPEGKRAEWGEGFFAAVRKVGMTEFPGMPRSVLGPILMHAGIPDYCLNDYFRLIAQRRMLEPSLSAERFLEWALAEESRLGSLDVPARQFLTYGSEFAHDYVERSFDLLDRLERAEEDLFAIGLPPAVVEKAKEAVERHPAGESSSLSPEQPRIVLDPFGQGVQVTLPAAAHWYVNADGLITSVRSQAPWPGLAETVPATTFTISSPVRTVVVTLAGSNYRLSLDVVDSVAPLIVFDERGQWLPAGLPMPPEDVWVLHPDDTDVEVSGDLIVRTEISLPLGWQGWRLRMISLEKTSSLALAGMPATTRSVRGNARPRLLHAGPVPGLTTPYGRPVVADLPALWLPGIRGARVRWAIQIRKKGAQAPMVSRTETVDGKKEITDLWAGTVRPLFGEFEVVVRGPLGRALREVVFIAEGACAWFDPEIRLFEEAGLAEGRARLTAAEGAWFQPEMVEFAGDVRDQLVEYHVSGRSAPLVVRPAHMAVLHESGEGTGWRTGPLRLETDRLLNEAGTLVVRIPGAGHLPALRMTAMGETVQELPPSGPVREGTARYDLKKAKDTLDRTEQAEFVLDTGSGPVRVAAVRPRSLATGVVHELDTLRLIDHVDGLTAGIYVLHAPWQEPRVIPVTAEGVIPIPEELTFAGPLLVHLQIDDPWAPVSWPRWPDRFLTAVLPGDENGYPRPPNDVSGRELSRFVVGERPMPQFLGSMQRAWILYALADRLSRATSVFPFRQNCAAALRRSPEAALIALGELGLGEEELAAALIGSGLAVSPPFGSRSAPGLWALAPVAAVLLSDLDDEATRTEARKHCGPAEFDELRATGTDRLARVSQLGDDFDALLGMTPEQIGAVWNTGRVPQPVLTSEARKAAARQVFLERNDPAVKAFGAVASSVVDRARRLLPGSPTLGLLDDRDRPADGRGDTAGWRRVPAASAALSVLARCAARGYEGCREVEERHRTIWSRFAAVAPRLAMLDLVVAELLLSR